MDQSFQNCFFTAKPGLEVEYCAGSLDHPHLKSEVLAKLKMLFKVRTELKVAMSRHLSW